MFDLFVDYQFIRYAVYASILTSLISGVIGVIIVEKRLMMMTGGIAHTSYGGVGLGYLLGFEPIFGAFGFATIAALGIGFINAKMTSIKDVMTAIFWSLGMALGILFIHMTPGYPPDLQSYLFGSILSVTTASLIMMVLITILVLFVILGYFNDWKAHLFDEEFMFVKGRKTKAMDQILMVVIALSVVVIIRVVGIILVIALMSIPAATAAMLTNKLHKRMIWSFIISLGITVGGLIISYITRLSSGAVIVILGFIVFMTVWVVKNQIFKRFRGEVNV